MIQKLSFNPKKEEGFTLVELLIVVAIIAILAAIAIPQFSAYRKRGYAATLNSDAKNAYTAAQAYFVETPAGSITACSQLTAAGYVTSNGVTCAITTAMTTSAGLFTFSDTGGVWVVSDATIDYNGLLTKSVAQ